MRWAMKHFPRTVYMFHAIAGYFVACLIAHFPVPSLVVILFVVALMTGIVNLKNDDGRMPE